MSIATVVETMMYDSGTLSSSLNIANTCICWLLSIDLLVMLSQSRMQQTVESQDRQQSLTLNAIAVHRGKAGKLWRHRDNETLGAIVTTKYPHMLQASTREHCHNTVLQICIRSFLIVLQETEQRPQQTSQRQNVFETCAQPSILAGLVTTGLLTHTVRLHCSI